MSSTVTRAIAVKYGSTTIGGTANYELDGPIAFEWTYDSVTVSFTAVVFATTDLLMSAACQDLEDAFRTPRQAFFIYIGGGTHRSWEPAKNTGFDAEPSIRQSPGRASSLRCRFYDCSVKVYLPATLAGEEGLFWLHSVLSTKPNGGRNLHVFGKFTAMPGVTPASATTQCLNKVADFTAPLLTDLSGVWKTITESLEWGRTNKTANFDYVYDELIWSETNLAPGDDGAIHADAEIKLMTFTFKRVELGIEDGAVSEVDVPADVRCEFSATLIKGVDPEQKWILRIRPWLYAHVEQLCDGRSAIVRGEEVEYERAQNKVRCLLTLGALSGFGILSMTYGIEVIRDFGSLEAPVWGTDGSPFARDVQAGPSFLFRRRVQSYLARGTVDKQEQIQRTLASLRALPIRGDNGWQFTAGKDRVPWKKKEDIVYLSGNWLLKRARHFATPSYKGYNKLQFVYVEDEVLEAYVEPVALKEEGGKSRETRRPPSMEIED